MLGGFLFCLPVIALISLIVYLPFFFVRRMKGARSLICHISAYALTGYCISLIYLTILWYWSNITFTPEWHFLNLQPFIWLTETYVMGAEKMTEQLLLNIGMFVPFGLLLPMNFKGLRKPWKTILVVLATTLCIETLQYFMGRSADVDDAITNLAGGALGCLVFLILNRCFRGKRFWEMLIGDAS